MGKKKGGKKKNVGDSQQEGDGSQEKKTATGVGSQQQPTASGDGPSQPRGQQDDPNQARQLPPPSRPVQQIPIVIGRGGRGADRKDDRQQPGRSAEKQSVPPMDSGRGATLKKGQTPIPGTQSQPQTPAAPIPMQQTRPPGMPMQQTRPPGMQQHYPTAQQPGMQHYPPPQAYGMQRPAWGQPAMPIPQQVPSTFQPSMQPQYRGGLIPPQQQMPPQQLQRGQHMAPQYQQQHAPHMQQQQQQHAPRMQQPQHVQQPQHIPPTSQQQVQQMPKKQKQPKQQQQTGEKTSQQDADKKEAKQSSKQEGEATPISKTEETREASKSPDGDVVGREIEIRKMFSKGGTAGRPIQLLANHFELTLGKIKKAYHYDFLATPDTPKKMMRPLYDMVKREFFPNAKPAFDGRKNIYTAHELPFGNSELTTTMVVPDDDRPGGKGREFKVRVKKVNEINLEEITKFVSGIRSSQIHRQPMNAIQVLDVVLRHSQSCYKINVGSSFFTVPKGPIIDLGGGMEMYRGSYQSVSLGWKPFLNIDISNKAFPQALNVVDLIYELNRFNRQFSPDMPLRPNQLLALNKHIKTMKVVYNLPNNPTAKRNYRVNEAVDSARMIKFKKDPKAPEITVEEYYKRDKNVTLKYPNMPCLWVGSRTSQMKVRVPSEFCKLVEGQAVKRKLDAQQTTAMIKQCATSTDIRKRGIQDAVSSANFSNDPIVKEFDLKVDTEFAKLTGRVLEPPNLGYENNRLVRVSKGVWNADRFFISMKLLEWTILNLDQRLRPGDLENLVQKINVCGRRLGMEVAPPKPYTTKRLSQGKHGLEELKDFFKFAKGKFSIVFVVITDFDFQYNYVKEASEIGVGCLTQCIKTNTVQRKCNDATVTNILLKVNAKLTGTNHHLLDRPRVMLKPTMIMGADVTHPSPEATGIPSVAAVTASHDPKAFQYNICWRLQQPGQEIIVDLKEITKEHLMFFYTKNRGCRPQNIIFFRDGVSNGQFLQVLRSELTAIRAACSAIDPTYKPNITFLVVQKRHNTRLFPVNKNDSQDRNNNVPAGTCVDTLITDAVVQNFFLVSHASIQGVAKPTKYVNLWDDYNFSDDELESLTYYLCHMFARCTRSVSYPAPTYYAHLAAARAKVYCETRQINIERLPSEQEKLKIKDEIIKDLPMFFI